MFVLVCRKMGHLCIFVLSSADTSIAGFGLQLPIGHSSLLERQICVLVRTHAHFHMMLMVLFLGRVTANAPDCWDGRFNHGFIGNHLMICWLSELPKCEFKQLRSELRNLMKPKLNGVPLLLEFLYLFLFVLLRSLMDCRISMLSSQWCKSITHKIFPGWDPFHHFILSCYRSMLRLWQLYVLTGRLPYFTIFTKDKLRAGRWT